MLLLMNLILGGFDIIIQDSAEKGKRILKITGVVIFGSGDNFLKAVCFRAGLCYNGGN